MPRAIDLIVRIAVDAQRAGQDIERAASSTEKFSAGIDTLAGPATIAAGAIGLFGKQAYDAASRAQQSVGAVDSVFGASADTIKGWSADSAQSVGLATASYEELASVAGAQLQNLGVDQASAAKQTDEMIRLGADLAATYGGDTATAVEALGSALKGEADPAEKYGLALNQTAVAARMAADGTDKLTGEALTAAKAQTIMQMATEGAGGAVGQFARESDSAAGAAQRAAAEWENGKAALGEALLPIISAVSTALGDMARWMGENTTLVTTLAAVIGTLAAGILAVKVALEVAQAAQAAWSAAQAVAGGITKAYTAVQAAFNAVMAMNPIGLIIIAIVALIAGIVLLWMNCEEFRDFFIKLWEMVSAAAVKAWDAIKAAAGAVFEWLKSTIGAVGDFFSGVWDKIKSAATAAWSGIKSMVDGVINGIKSAIETAGRVIVGVWDAIKAAGTAVWDAIKSAAMGPINAVKSAIDGIKRAIDAVIEGIKTAIKWIKDLASSIASGVSNAWDAITPWSATANPSGAGVTTAAGAGVTSSLLAASASPSLARTLRRNARGGTSQAGATVIVNGALDPVAVARQIRSLLVAQDRRTSGLRT